MRKTPHTRQGKSIFELQYGREPNTEISILLNLDTVKTITNNCFSAKPDTLQVYSFYGAGDASDRLTMKQKKGSKGVSNYPFQFFEKRVNKPKIRSAYSDKFQTAVSGTKHTVTTAEKKLHSKHISKPISEFAQEQINRGTGLRGPDGRFTKSPRLTHETKSDGDSEKSNPATLKMDTTQIKEGTARNTETTKPHRTQNRTDHLEEDARNWSETDKALVHLPAQQTVSACWLSSRTTLQTRISTVLLKTREKRTKNFFFKDTNGKVTRYYKNTVHGGEKNKENYLGSRHLRFRTN